LNEEAVIAAAAPACFEEALKQVHDLFSSFQRQIVRERHSKPMQEQLSFDFLADPDDRAAPRLKAAPWLSSAPS
jgi:hypothetical protein